MASTASDQAGAQLFAGGHAAERFDGARGFALFALDHAEKKVDRLGQSGERDGAEQNAAEPLVGELLLTAERARESGGAAGFGERKGGFAGGVIASFKKAGNKSDGGIALDGQQRREALARGLPPPPAAEL